MKIIRKDLGKIVDYDDLEKAILEAAKDMKFRIEKKEIPGEDNKCGYTDFHLKKRFLGSMEIIAYHRKDNFFTIYPRRLSDKKINEYLEKINEYL